MKLIFLIIVSFSMALCCCKTNAQSNQRKVVCDTFIFKNDLLQNWKYDSAREYFMTNDSFIKRLSKNYSDCLYGYDIQIIKKYFGNNFRTIKMSGYKSSVGAIEYLLSPVIKNSKQGSYEHNVLLFYYNNDNHIQWIEKIYGWQEVMN